MDARKYESKSLTVCHCEARSNLLIDAEDFKNPKTKIMFNRKLNLKSFSHKLKDCFATLAMTQAHRFFNHCNHNKMKLHHYYVYILTNQNNTVLYVGVTNDIIRRVWEHKNPVDKKSFTARYNIDKLVYYETFQFIQDAIDREK